jgi:hypothetical protein
MISSKKTWSCHHLELSIVQSSRSDTFYFDSMPLIYHLIWEVFFCFSASLKGAESVNDAVSMLLNLHLRITEAETVGPYYRRENWGWKDNQGKISSWGGWYVPMVPTTQERGARGWGRMITWAQGFKASLSNIVRAWPTNWLQVRSQSEVYSYIPVSEHINKPPDHTVNWTPPHPPRPFYNSGGSV